MRGDRVFEGFSRDTITFFLDLRFHNSKSFMDAKTEHSKQASNTEKSYHAEWRRQSYRSENREQIGGEMGYAQRNTKYFM